MDFLLENICVFWGCILVIFFCVCLVVIMILFLGVFNGLVIEVVYLCLFGGRICVWYVGVDWLCVIICDFLFFISEGDLGWECVSLVIIILVFRFLLILVGIMLLFVNFFDLWKVVVGDDLGWNFCFCILCVCKIFCMCVFILFKVFLLCLICGGVFVICFCELFGGVRYVMFRLNVGVLEYEGGFEGRLFCVLVCINLCVWIWECVSFFGGVLL